MIGIRADQHLCQQMDGGIALVDDMGSNNLLDNRVAPLAGPLAESMALPFEQPVHVIQLLAKVWRHCLICTAVTPGDQLWCCVVFSLLCCAIVS